MGGVEVGCGGVFGMWRESEREGERRVFSKSKQMGNEVKSFAEVDFHRDRLRGSDECVGHSSH